LVNETLTAEHAVESEARLPSDNEIGIGRVEHIAARCWIRHHRLDLRVTDLLQQKFAVAILKELALISTP